MKSKLLSAVVIAVCVPTATAHEFWIEPATHRPVSGSRMKARLLVGHAAEKEPYARNPAHLAEFFVLGPDGRHDVVGRPGDDPAGTLLVDGEGTFVLAYRSNPSVLEMEAEKFEAYLLEEGLEPIVVERRARGESRSAGREAYSRCAKALVRTPGAAAAAGGHDRVLGLPLELVPLADPFLHLAGEPARPLSFRLLADGVPLAGAKVHAQSLDHLELTEIAARTDKRGVVELVLPRGGRWIVSSVQMKRAEEGADQEWRSHWASISFLVAGEKNSQPD